jgi:hypothetical protein
VAQDRDLDILRIRSLAAADHADYSPQDKERQSPHHHGSRSCQLRIPAAHCRTLTLHPTGVAALPTVRPGERSFAR